MASNSSKRDQGRLHLRLVPALKRQLEQYAKRNHMTVTAVVVFAIIQFIRKEPEQWTSEK